MVIFQEPLPPSQQLVPRSAALEVPQAVDGSALCHGDHVSLEVLHLTDVLFADLQDRLPRAVFSLGA
jgi:hypothetical protein